jgi:cytochrome c oxidase subunit III
MDDLTPAAGARVDVSRLPTVTWGRKGLMWWGTLSFMVIEGWTLGLTVLSYFYVRQNVESWPPLRTPNPSLAIPTINLLVMLVSVIPAWIAAKRAKAFDRAGTMVALAISGLFGIVILVLRWYEFWAINTRWDTNVYGSVAWLIVGFHATLLLLDVGDTIGLAVIFRREKLAPHYFPDATDNSMYWYFTILNWIPLYFIVYVGPYLF